MAGETPRAPGETPGHQPSIREMKTLTIYEKLRLYSKATICIGKSTTLSCISIWSVWHFSPMACQGELHIEIQRMGYFFVAHTVDTYNKCYRTLHVKTGIVPTVQARILESMLSLYENEIISGYFLESLQARSEREVMVEPRQRENMQTINDHRYQELHCHPWDSLPPLPL